MQYGSTALMSACGLNKDNALDVVKAVLKGNPDIDRQDNVRGV